MCCPTRLKFYGQPLWWIHCPCLAVLNLYSLAKITILVKSNSAHFPPALVKLNVAAGRYLNTLTVLPLESWSQTSSQSHYSSLMHLLLYSQTPFSHVSVFTHILRFLAFWTFHISVKGQSRHLCPRSRVPSSAQGHWASNSPLFLLDHHIFSLYWIIPAGTQIRCYFLTLQNKPTNFLLIPLLSPVNSTFSFLHWHQDIIYPLRFLPTLLILSP